MRCIAAGDKALKSRNTRGCCFRRPALTLDNGAGRERRGWNTAGKRVPIIDRKADDQKMKGPEKMYQFTLMYFPDFSS
jgi:hypothetical protein